MQIKSNMFTMRTQQCGVEVRVSGTIRLLVWLCPLLYVRAALFAEKQDSSSLTAVHSLIQSSHSRLHSCTEVAHESD